MFIMLTDVLTGHEIILRKDLIDRIFEDTVKQNGVDVAVRHVAFIDNKPSEYVKETLLEIYTKLL